MYLNVYKTILENDGTLKSISDWYKTQEICDKAIDNYVHSLEFVPDCYKTRKMFKTVNTCFFVFNFVYYQCKTQKKWQSCFKRSFYAKILLR